MKPPFEVTVKDFLKAARMAAKPTILRKGELRLGFGCSGVWGKPWFSRKEAISILHAAIDGGVTHIDTAGFYGEAEARLGAVSKNMPQEALFISTKTGTRYTPNGAVKNFTPEGIIADVDASLKRLGREQIDLLYLHGPTDAELAGATPVLEHLKAEGKIHLAGVCGEGPFLAQAARAPQVDVIMGAYNLFRREHGEIFQTAKKNGKNVVAIAPLAQGLYRQDFFRPRSLADGWHLARALVKNRDELRQARAARSVLQTPGWAPAGLALAFVLANPDIDIAVTTTTKAAHLLETLDASTSLLPRDLLSRLEALN